MSPRGDAAWVRAAVALEEERGEFPPSGAGGGVVARHAPSWVRALVALQWTAAEIAPLRHYVAGMAGARVGDVSATRAKLAYAAGVADARKLAREYVRGWGFR